MRCKIKVSFTWDSKYWGPLQQQVSYNLTTKCVEHHPYYNLSQQMVTLLIPWMTVELDDTQSIMKYWTRTCITKSSQLFGNKRARCSLIKIDFIRFSCAGKKRYIWNSREYFHVKHTLKCSRETICNYADCLFVRYITPCQHYFSHKMTCYFMWVSRENMLFSH